MCIQIGMGKINKNMEHLQCCIVERWDGISDKLLDLYTLISWARFNMRLKRKLHLALMGGSLIMSEFQKVVVAERVLQLGMRNFREKSLYLEKWAPQKLVLCL